MIEARLETTWQGALANRVYKMKPIAVGSYQQRAQREREMVMQPCSHQLVPKKLEESLNIVCSYCNTGNNKGHPIFECLQCNIFLDESCSKLPHEIQHPLHPTHYLTLTITKRSKPLDLPLQSMDRKRCYACGECLFNSFYRCLQCDFNLCLGCDSLILTTNQDSHQIQKEVITTTHPHPLIQCYRNEYFCSGCYLHLENYGEENSISIYVCLDCQMLLCKSCVCLPHEIEHPFHPAHSLSLAGHNIPGTISGSGASYPECAGCLQMVYRRGRGLFYECRKCIFNLHIGGCTSLMPHFVNSQVHLQHPLALLDVQVYNVRCNVCNLHCNYPFFSCSECRFIFHAHCLPDLPTSLKYKWHLHPLTLTHLPIKDYEDESDHSEFYCDACEKHRRLNDPTYYCEECHYVAHVHCVISEILPYLHRESSSGDKLNNMKLDISMSVVKDNAGAQLGGNAAKETVEDAIKELGNVNIDGDPTILDELNAETAILHKLVDELEAEEETLATQLEVLTRQLEAVTTQLKTQKKKLDHFKERRAQYMLSLERSAQGQSARLRKVAKANVIKL